ncbi:MAG: butyrate kinase, partial [Bacilli bacterium]|nr:butyrate kinase [Bacilli bacterium]
MNDKYILVINPGSLTTKIAVYLNTEPLFTAKINHPLLEISHFPSIISQLEYRLNLVLKKIEEHQFDLKLLSAVCGRGGMLPPLESGTYLINQEMLDFLINANRGEHASNLGVIIAYQIASDLGVPAYTVDPVSVDEMDSLARISGMPLIERQSLFHALNQKAIGRQVAADQGKDYCDLNLIITHIGGGISVAAHRRGRIIDVNNGLDGDGPMSPERSGTVPLGPLYKMCFSGQYTLSEIKKMNYGQIG